VESLVVEVDVRYKPLKASELTLLLLLRHDDKPLRISRSIWRWSGWSCRVARSDGRLLRASLRFGEPHRWASCGPCHRGEECCSSSTVSCPPQYSEETRKPSASSKRLSIKAWTTMIPSSLVKKLIGFFHDCSTLPHKYISGVFNR
jgi:hypothetical protein